MAPLVGVATATEQNAPVFVGLGLIGIGAISLWYRQDLYLKWQWIIRYPPHGLVYWFIQFVCPTVLIAGGIALLATVVDSHWAV